MVLLAFGMRMRFIAVAEEQRARQIVMIPL